MTYNALRRDLLRLLALALVFAAVVGLFARGVAIPATRDASLLAIGYALVLIVGYELLQRGLDGDRVIRIAGALAAGLGLAWLAWRILFPPPPEPAGALLPAGEPTPSGLCRAAPGALVMALGSNRVVATGNGPVTPFYAGSCPGPILTRTPQGLMVTAFGYTWTDDIAYGIRDNQLQTDPLPGLHFRRPDRSSLVLLDRFEHEVVYIRYLNRDAVRIRGRFLCGEQPQSVIEQDRILVGGLRIGGVMFRQHVTAGHVCARISPAMPYGIRLTR